MFRIKKPTSDFSGLSLFGVMFSGLVHWWGVSVLACFSLYSKFKI